MTTRKPIAKNAVLFSTFDGRRSEKPVRPVNRRFASTAFGEGYGDMTPAERAARKAWLEDSYAREQQLVSRSGLVAGYTFPGGAAHGSPSDDSDALDFYRPSKTAANVMRQRRAAVPVIAGSRSKPLFNRAALDSVLHMPEDSAYVSAKDRFACVPRLADFRIRFRDRKAWHKQRGAAE